jgi:hypothetical protein
MGFFWFLSPTRGKTTEMLQSFNSKSKFASQPRNLSFHSKVPIMESRASLNRIPKSHRNVNNEHPSTADSTFSSARPNGERRAQEKLHFQLQIAFRLSLRMGKQASARHLNLGFLIFFISPASASHPIQKNIKKSHTQKTS